jgi:hypothetical protein
MKKLLFAVALISGAAHAQNFGTETRVLAYWQKPIGAENPMASAPSMGLQFRTGPTTPTIAPFKSAVVDFRFGNQGFQSFSLNGIVLRQNQAPGSAPTSEINWWIVGGVALGAAIIVHQENRKDKQQAPACTPAIGPGGVPTCI